MFDKKGGFLPALPGMTSGTLVEILTRDGNKIDKQYLARISMLFGISMVNSVLSCVERHQNMSKIMAESIPKSPVFILGYFRSGTTFLQNILSLDVNNITPNTYFCLFPNHFHYSRKNGIRILNRLIPQKRPMDNVCFSGNVPYEDEFATAALSSVSPYFRFLFPNNENEYMALDPHKLPVEALERWKDAMCYVMKSISFWKDERWVLLKSPLHTGRVGTLLSLFPDAKFIHIVRNPYHVYRSNKKMWDTTLSRVHMQTPDPGRVDTIIFSWYRELFSLLERDRTLIPKGSFVEIKFEDLERNLTHSVKEIYEQLDLPGFNQLESQVLKYMESSNCYIKNNYKFDLVDKQRVYAEWKSTFKRYGYFH